MKFTFKNLGKLDEAEIEVKDLTIVCGENNTGKTYLLYAIYGFWAYLLRSDIPLLSADVKTSLHTQKKIELNIEEVFSIEKINSFLGKVAKEYALKQIDRDFVSKPKFFENLKMDVELSRNDYTQVINSLKKELHSLDWTRSSSEGLIHFDFEIKDDILFIEQRKSEINTSLLFIILNNKIKENIFQSFYKNNFFSSSERTGIVMFKDELDFARRRLLDIASEGKRLNHFEIFERILVDYKDTYSRPIKNEAEFIRNLLAYEKLKKKDGIKESEQSLLNMKQLEDIIGGVLELSSDGTIYFKPNKNKSLRLTMDQVSSSIRSILSLYFYIRDQGHKENQILMIDEPEMNLHPKNQRAMARFLASLVNQGIKVMVSTHSDYLVRELSHLTALHQYKEKDSVKAYLADEKNPYSEEVLISPDQVGLYYTTEDLVLKKGNKTKSKGIVLKRVEPNAYGAFDVDSFDKTIIEQNETGTDIVNLVTPFVEEEQ
jgi:predicted ATP-dependent endonuclease of OLD family